jgi:polyferredoxin
MLKNIRVVLAIPVFILLTFYFLDFADVLPEEIHVLGRIQFVPALISHNILVAVCLIIFTLIFGRVYCSFVCPTGIFQDIIIRFLKGDRFANRAVYKKNYIVLRWSIVAISVILFFCGFTLIAGILDPYSAYGRIAVHIFKPIYTMANNILALVFNRFGNYAFYISAINVLSVFSLTVALSSLVIIALAALTNGRLYCNAICPVGTVLGFINKFSLFKIKINGDKCVSCGI